MIVAATSRPAERASSVSSARESSASTRLAPVTPMRMARSRLLPCPGVGQPGKFRFQGSHQGFEIQVQGAHLPGLDDGPALAVHRLGQQVGDLDGARLAVGHGESAATASRRSKARSMRSSWLRGLESRWVWIRRRPLRRPLTPRSRGRVGMTRPLASPTMT